MDSLRNNGRRGVVSSVVLTFEGFGELPPAGTYSVMDLVLVADLGRCGGHCAARLAFEDGLHGSGQPVFNALNWAGETILPCNTDGASLRIRFQGRGEPFLRGNANSDARVNTSDLIFILGELFESGSLGRCRDAEDANGDGGVDISDPIFLFQYLFLGGGPPPAPFPSCGTDPGRNGPRLGCSEAQTACAAGDPPGEEGRDMR